MKNIEQFEHDRLTEIDIFVKTMVKTQNVIMKQMTNVAHNARIVTFLTLKISIKISN